MKSKKFFMRLLSYFIVTIMFFSTFSMPVMAKKSDTGVQDTKPDIPLNATTAVKETEITVTWAAVDGATGYDIEVDKEIIDNSSSTVYVHSSLTPGTEHVYRVRSKNESGTSEWSEAIIKSTSQQVEKASQDNTVEKDDKDKGDKDKGDKDKGDKDKDKESSDTIPPIPENINATATDSTINITWDKVKDAKRYEIEADGTVTDNGNKTVFVHNGLLPDTKHQYRVRAVNEAGTSNWSSYVSVVTLPAITLSPPGNGIGLKGEYFDKNDLTGLKVTRVDETVNFDWKREAPDPSVSRDDFSVRWTGQVVSRFSGLHTFYTETHGGVRLWVDDKLLIDDWDRHGMTHRSGEIVLAADQNYYIKMEYRRSNGVAVARLLWSNPILAKEVIPKSQLFIIGIPGNTSTTASETSITLNWSPVDFATGYDVEVDGNVTDAGSGTCYVHNGLIPGTQHTYRVRAKCGSINGDWSPYVTGITLINTPSNISIEATESSIALSWEPIAGAIGYDIEIDGTVSDNGLSTSYTNCNLESGTLHNYRIRARGKALIGSWSNLIAKWTLPGVPQNVAASAEEAGIVLSWDYVRGASGYDIEIDSGVTENVVSPYVSSGLMPGTEHKYRIRAKNSSGTGKWSKEISKMTLSEVTGEITFNATENEIKVAWGEATGATGYDMEVDGKVIEDVSSPFTHDLQFPGTEHKYRIRAKNVSGIGKWSSEYIKWTLPERVRNVAAEAAETTISVSWSPVTGATGYDLELDGLLKENVSSPYMVEGLLPGTEHIFKVRAKNTSGPGMWSEQTGKTTIPGTVDKIGAEATETDITLS